MSRFNNISFFLFIMTLMVSCTSSRTSLTYFEDLKGEQSGTLSSAGIVYFAAAQTVYDVAQRAPHDEERRRQQKAF